MTLPGDAEQSTIRQREEGIPRKSQPASSSSCAAADTSMQNPDPQIPVPAWKLSCGEIVFRHLQERTAATRSQH